MKLLKEKILLPTQYTVPVSSTNLRDKLVKHSQQITKVNSVISQEEVAIHARELRTLIKDAKAVCAPIIKRLMDAAAEVRKLRDSYCAPPEAEQERCERMLVDFQKREEERVAAETAARMAEIERLKALQRAGEPNPTQTTPDSPEALQAEMEAHDAQQAMEALILAPAPEAVKPKGVSIQRRMRVEVLDVHALYAARPDLVRLEANLSAIQDSCVPEIQIPGIRTWWETTAETRAA